MDLCLSLPFLLRLPEKQKKDEEIAEKYDIRGLHLLAAEDNELNAEIIEMLLTDDGAKVTVAKNGRQAVEYFESNPPGTFDAILMDVMMPVMDGIAATKAIRAMDRADAKTIPIIAMTANAFEEDAKRCLAAGMTAHLAKPFQIEDVEKSYCGVLWKVMPSARSIAISKLSEAASKLIFVPIKIKKSIVLGLQS